MPDWFSFENNAGSIAVADLGSGTTDVVVYQIDNPPGISQGFYKIGKNLDANGEVQKDGWSFWTVLPGWFSFENAGGGVAVMNVAGKHKLLTMFIDARQLAEVEGEVPGLKPEPDESDLKALRKIAQTLRVATPIPRCKLVSMETVWGQCAAWYNAVPIHSARMGASSFITFF